MYFRRHVCAESAGALFRNNRTQNKHIPQTIKQRKQACTPYCQKRHICLWNWASGKITPVWGKTLLRWILGCGFVTSGLNFNHCVAVHNTHDFDRHTRPTFLCAQHVRGSYSKFRRHCAVHRCLSIPEQSFLHPALQWNRTDTDSYSAVLHISRDVVDDGRVGRRSRDGEPAEPDRLPGAVRQRAAGRGREDGAHRARCVTDVIRETVGRGGARPLSQCKFSLRSSCFRLSADWGPGPETRDNPWQKHNLVKSQNSFIVNGSRAIIGPITLHGTLSPFVVSLSRSFHVQLWANQSPSCP